MSLDELRVKIDEIDAKLLALLDERAVVAREIGEIKNQSSLPAYDPSRESAVLDALEAKGTGDMPGSSLRSIWREIMSASLSLQLPTKVAFFGPAGTFTHQAASAHFGNSVTYTPEQSIPAVFSAVESGRSEIGVVPIENSTEGPVNITADTLLDTTARIIGESYMPIHLALLGNCELKDVKRVCSHSQPLAQCRRYLEEVLPQAELIETSSSSVGALRAVNEQGTVAIGAQIAAEIYDIKIIADKIEDVPDNQTRFFIIGNNTPDKTGNDKTSLLVSIKDEVGALHSLLSTFKEHGVNLTWIQSRPSRRRAWDYRFFIDCVGHITEQIVQDAISSIESGSRHVQVLGSYPAMRGGKV